jgi:hypothetical protein
MLPSVRKDAGRDVNWPDGLVAFWDFAEGAPPFATRRGCEPFPLRNGAGADVSVIADGPFGQAATFDGTSDYLVVPAADVGALNLSRHGNECSVLAWVKRANASIHFIAGMWQEDDNDPRRQYGLFVSLPMYGGEDQVCGHVSFSGGPTPGYPFSRDYSASLHTVDVNEWRFVGFTYDGAQIISYLDGAADSRPAYTDIQGEMYPKNPYPYPLGLNTSTVSDFTVGAVKLTAGYANFFSGRLGGLAVFSRALSPLEMETIHHEASLAA